MSGRGCPPAGSPGARIVGSGPLYDFPVTTAHVTTPRAFALIARDIKLAHSVFALPFAVFASFLARDRAWPEFLAQLALVVVCMVLARTWAMLVNRLLDRRIDARNARTRRRVFASGELSPSRGWFIAGGCVLLFAAAAGLFLVFFNNPWPLALSLPVLLFLAFYSLTKRFTAWCHVILGISLALSPLAAALAVNPGSFASTPAILWTGVFVLPWVAGFDVIYALQDAEFDTSAGLFSIPARLGPRGAIWVSRLLHLIALVALVMIQRTEPRLGFLYIAALAAVALLLLAEHVVIARRGSAGIPMAFFTLNGCVSCILGVLGCTSIHAANPW